MPIIYDVAKEFTYHNFSDAAFKVVPMHDGGAVPITPIPFTQSELDTYSNEFTTTDIILGMHRCSRWVGQLSWRSTTLEHSIHCDKTLEYVLKTLGFNIKQKRIREHFAWIRLKMLLHDATEAFVGDLPHALKYALVTTNNNTYREIVWNLQNLINHKFGLTDLVNIDARGSSQIHSLCSYIDQLSAHIEFQTFGHVIKHQPTVDLVPRLRRYPFYHKKHLTSSPPWPCIMHPDTAIEEFNIQLDKLTKRYGRARKHTIEFIVGGQGRDPVYQTLSAKKIASMLK